MLLIFNNSFEDDPGAYACGASVVETKFVDANAMFKRRKFVGRDSRAIVAPITICNQNLQKLFEDRKIERRIDQD